MAFLLRFQSFFLGLAEGLNIVNTDGSNYTTCEVAVMEFYNQTKDVMSTLGDPGVNPITKALNVSFLLNLTYPLSTECYYGAFQSLERFSGVISQVQYAITNLQETQ